MVQLVNWILAQNQQNRRYSLVDEYEGCWAKQKSKTTNWKVDANWKRTSVKHIEHHITIELNLNELKHLVFKNIKCSQSSSDGQKKSDYHVLPCDPKKGILPPLLSRAWDPPGTHPTPKNDPEGAQKGHKGSSLQTFKIVSILRNICPTCGFERGVVDPGVQPYGSRLPHTGQRPLARTLVLTYNKPSFKMNPRSSQCSLGFENLQQLWRPHPEDSARVSSR